ncbi:S1C family serine protease [Neobacillus kokaensis]|uniref:Serine protease Do-like HtrB n=1 Tax=Neobacillus kokaensis TaxID=2759023 RepID=A0ABQ3NC57_9BACI|nr:trypsin-like peptidase domain-containing protein [Neobacillus kokaensis]GHI01517.1 serine protease Do-like HtrB [Neobacillus kokaensis]
MEKEQFEQENSIDLSIPANPSGHLNEVEDEQISSSDTLKEEAESKQNPVTDLKIDEKSTNHADLKSPMKKSVKGFASTLAAGVIGSVLTLTILPHTDYFKNFQPQAEDRPVQMENNSAQVKPVSANTSNSIADTVEKVSKAIVGIENYQQQQSVDFFGNSGPSQNVEQGSGSGVIFEKQNGHAYIVTNNHVVEGASKLEVSLYDGTKAHATVVGTDALTDLAVLKIEGKNVSSTASFGDSTTLRPGDQVYAIGNPLGLDLSRTVTQGIVSATNRSISVPTSAGNWETTVIQTDAAINPGNSGGALINPQGQVVGINSMKIAESGVEGLGFAIPSNDVIPIVNQLIKNGKIERPYIGIGLADLDEVPQVYWGDLPKNVTKGVIVMNIDPNSAAARGGFQPKDVIVSMNGEKIANSSELRKYLYSKVKSGDKIKFEVYRDGKLKNLTVKLTNQQTSD